jgi:hypothetical protein
MGKSNFCGASSQRVKVANARFDAAFSATIRPEPKTTVGEA